MDYLEREKTIKEAFQKEIRKILELSTKDKQNLHIQCKSIDFIKNSGIEDLLDDLCKSEEELHKYKDLEEQNHLLKLSCNVGDKVYFQVCNIDFVWCQKISKIEVREDGIHYLVGKCVDFTDKDINKTIFLTEEEAERKIYFKEK